MPQSRALIRAEEIQSRIQEIRGQKVIIDADLARFYGVETRRLNEQVRRNKDKFPADFLFPLTSQEVEILKSQNAISRSHGGRRKTTYAFTEHGALMAANVLRSKKANQTSVLIIRAFIALRDAGKQQRQLLDEILAQLEEHGSKIGQHDAEISGIVKFLTEIMKMQKAEKKFLN
ncbi:MAG TPA: DNA-binding protein [Deltaproteobacteria bacterium]|nr:DNA-binding protein [Deltaproteobacteria bacterium]